jgi:ADP-ribosylation factor GTPase-activating protein 1
MDRWSEKQIKLMKAGGNKQLNDFLEEYQIKTKKTTAKEKYDNPVAELYRQKLDARVEGRIEPTELPKVPVKVNVPLRKMEGFGSSPPPPRPASHTGRNVALGGIAVAIVGVGAWLVLQQ